MIWTTVIVVALLLGAAGGLFLVRRKAGAQVDVKTAGYISLVVGIVGLVIGAIMLAGDRSVVPPIVLFVAGILLSIYGGVLILWRRGRSEGTT